MIRICSSSMDISAHKKQDDDDQLVLIPGLPNHLAHLCLSSIDPFLLYSVSHSWRRFIYSPDFPPFFSLYALLCPTSSSSSSSNDSAVTVIDNIQLFCFDPISSKWNPLPSPNFINNNPSSNPPLPRILYRHPSFISRKFPIQSLTVAGKLLIISATSPDFLPALSQPLLFDPLSKKWFFGPPLHTQRRWCIAAAESSSSSPPSVYVASGVRSGFERDVGRSIEKWDIINNNSSCTEYATEYCKGKWDKIGEYRDGRFSREANEGVVYKGKLCMVNIKGHAVNKDGAVYNTLSNEWEEMPPRMLRGWQGPAGMDEERQVMYVVDEENGVLSKYDPDGDRWEEVIKSPENLKGATQIAVGRGRVCAAVCGGIRITIVDVVNKPARIWVVNPPPQMEVISVHILPRFTHY